MIKTASQGEKPLGSDLFTFAVGGSEPLFLDEKTRQHWRNVHATEMQETEECADLGLCLVTGETNVPLARTHTPMVTGLPKPAKGTGAGIVGFESPSFRSYGFEKSYNAPTSVAAPKAYLLALQHLSKRDDHWLTLGPAWLCFWAAQSESASSLFARLLNKPDPLTVRKFMTTPWAGIEKPPPNMEKFFAVTLTAAGPRIVVKEWLQTTVAEAADNFRRWFADLELVIPPRPPAKQKPAGEEKEFHPLSVYWLARCTVREAKDLAPEIPAQLYRAALEGSAPSVNHYFYCPRRAALIHIEGIFTDNEHTLRGDIVHEHADLPGYEVAKGVTLLRALPVFSERLGLSGKCDIVEVELRPNVKSQISDLKSGGIAALKPVEFKLGKRRQWENDDAQLCAQALCLEEMFGVNIPRGAIFHADSKRRREVEFTAELRALTENAVQELHALLREFEISNLKSQIAPLPAAVFKPACEECSLYDICLPKATAEDSRAARLSRALFQI